MLGYLTAPAGIKVDQDVREARPVLATSDPLGISKLIHHLGPQVLGDLSKDGALRIGLDVLSSSGQ